MTDSRVFRTLARNWEALGDTDPLFGVLSDPTKYGGKWDPVEFFSSGRAHVTKLMRTLADARASFDSGTCLDFGCGPGRLTIPLSESFEHTIGVDIARPMVEAARRHAPLEARCNFVVNRRPDLRGFGNGLFDFVHSCLVLQHIPPEIAIGYVAEFFRIAKPGGLVVFQMPAATRTESEISAAHALPDSAFSAAVGLVDPPVTLDTSSSATVMVRVRNVGDVTWRHDIPAGRHICVGNHWLSNDGTPAVFDDGRARLPRPVKPHQSVDVALHVQAPEAPGQYILEVDLVQEHVCWFAQKGSLPGRTTMSVTGGRMAPEPVSHEPTPERAYRPGAPPGTPLFRRLLRRLGGGTPTFEMYTIPRHDVEAAIRGSGGLLIRAVDDNAAGPGWLSYTYVCRKPLDPTL